MSAAAAARGRTRLGSPISTMLTTLTQGPLPIESSTMDRCSARPESTSCSRSGRQAPGTEGEPTGTGSEMTVTTCRSAPSDAARSAAHRSTWHDDVESWTAAITTFKVFDLHDRRPGAHEQPASAGEDALVERHAVQHVGEVLADRGHSTRGLIAISERATSPRATHPTRDQWIRQKT